MTIEGVLSSQLVRLLDWENAHTAQADIPDFCAVALRRPRRGLNIAGARRQPRLVAGVGVDDPHQPTLPHRERTQRL